MIVGRQPFSGFEQDLRDEIVRYLPYDRTDSRLTGELAEMPTSELLVWFFNWLNRLIHPHPRQVFKSREYLFRRLDAREQVLLDRLTDKIEAGTDVNPHLSRRIMQGYVGRKPESSGKNLGGRRDLDLLLNDWSIHHLHLSETVVSDGFVRRERDSDPDLLLFAIFREDSAYLVDVGLHGAWADRRLVEISVRNWPDESLFLPLNGIIPPRQDPDRSERHTLRSIGVASPISVDGKAYVGRGIMSSAGTTMAAARQASRLRHSLSHISKGIAADPDHLRPMIEASGHTYPRSPRFRLVFLRSPSRWEFAIREEVTESLIGIAP
jgi:hypothetical protein